MLSKHLRWAPTFRKFDDFNDADFGTKFQKALRTTLLCAHVAAGAYAARAHAEEAAAAHSSSAGEDARAEGDGGHATQPRQASRLPLPYLPEDLWYIMFDCLRAKDFQAPSW